MKTSHKWSILIADDHSVVRAGLKALLTIEPDFEIVGEADNGVKAVLLYAKLKPDVILLDMRMPIKDGRETTKEIRSADPDAKVLVLSTYKGDEEIYDVLEAGASGYVLKNSPREELVRALRAVLAGKRWISPEIGRQLSSRKLTVRLTGREVEVLQGLVTGDSNKELASVLGITEHTIKAHLKSIIAKLNVRDRTEAVTVGLRRGIIRLSE